MKLTSTYRRSLSVAIAFALAAAIAGCGSKEPPPQATTAAAPPPAVEGQVACAGACRAAGRRTGAHLLDAEALEDLLAPVALYPDPVLAQLLVATTNPQEVLDAGNWLIANPNLEARPSTPRPKRSDSRCRCAG